MANRLRERPLAECFTEQVRQAERLVRADKEVNRLPRGSRRTEHKRSVKDLWEYHKVVLTLAVVFDSDLRQSPRSHAQGLLGGSVAAIPLQLGSNMTATRFPSTLGLKYRFGSSAAAVGFERPRNSASADKDCICSSCSAARR